MRYPDSNPDRDVFFKIVVVPIVWMVWAVITVISFMAHPVVGIIVGYLWLLPTLWMHRYFQ